MTEAEVFRWVLIEGAIGGAVLSLIAFLLSKLASDVAGRTLLATVLFAAAGAYLGFAFEQSLLRPWVLVELLQCVAFGTLGLYGWRGNAKWLALGWALHPFWDFPLHYVGPGRSFAPWTYAVACITLDWVVATYILIYYRGSSRLAQNSRR
jgi:Family of unknown function (DUF6010)